MQQNRKHVLSGTESNRFLKCQRYPPTLTRFQTQAAGIILVSFVDAVRTHNVPCHEYEGYFSFVMAQAKNESGLGSAPQSSADIMSEDDDTVRRTEGRTGEQTGASERFLSNR